MHKSVILAAVFGALALPAAAQATGTPTATDRQSASAECRAERGATAATHEAFSAKYGTNANRANAFGKCVSAKAREEAKEREDAKDSAAQTCRTERGTTADSHAAFDQKYGTTNNKNNAFGKCVSAAAKQAEAKADEQDHERSEARKSAAKRCAQERGTSSASREAFAKKYGTNANHRNAFGKCVSKVAQSL
ncbi:hypothetical protein DVA67_034175 [Solirubrobacter sp. CPCC 204708]|uniref:Uncharacterized protein n=1 Tax=Solirubrobacter deserti TaxID=2282478 RepID=A0ABT4RVW0_9ACTN|nr:hypothetical protein [Solirubrobacter deserti]MBE2321046.1 hypothetical protein [Solirubrobacter deserti]MDA0142498.1 hypothetical protein [Solirubrobacter deserti]